MRSSLTVGENLLMLLMPASSATGWYLVLWTAVPLRETLFGLSCFYFLWALKNYLTTFPMERAHFAFGLVLSGFYLGEGSQAGGVLISAGVLGALLGFCIASAKTLPMSTGKLAYVMKKTVLWTHVLRTYYISSVCFWSLALYRLGRPKWS